MKELFKYIIYVHEKKEYSSSSCDRYCVTVIKLITKPADLVITKESWNYARNYSLLEIQQISNDLLQMQAYTTN